MATSAKDRGKYAENKLKEYLTKVDARLARFDFLRLPDARTARGRMPAMPGDFEFFAVGLHGLLEVKEVAHSHLVPAKNITQLPKMRKRVLAGGRCFVIIYFSRTDKWRCIPAEQLELRTTGSWDLSSYPEHDTIDEALPIELLGG